MSAAISNVAPISMSAKTLMAIKVLTYGVMLLPASRTGGFARAGIRPPFSNDPPGATAAVVRASLNAGPRLCTTLVRATMGEGIPRRSCADDMLKA
jgi:hypothetical protein